MFQNSFFNRVDVKCIHHNSKYLSHICGDYKCGQNPFICEECLSSYTFKQKHSGHQSSIRPIQTQIENISEEIDRNRKPIEAIYRNLISDKQSQNLLRWQQDSKQHFISIHNHIKSVKHLVEEQIETICRKFKQSLIEEKKLFDKELQRFQELYKTKFQEFTNFTQPIVYMSTIYKYCANKNNIILKLVSQTTDFQTISWYNHMKRTVRLSAKVAKDPTSYSNELKKLSSAANDLIDDLPRIRQPQYEHQLSQVLSSASKQILHTFVKLRETTPIIQRTHSMQNQTNHWRSSK